MIVSNNDLYLVFLHLLAKEFPNDFCFVVLRGGVIARLEVNIQAFH